MLCSLFVLIVYVIVEVVEVVEGVEVGHSNLSSKASGHTDAFEAETEPVEDTVVPAVAGMPSPRVRSQLMAGSHTKHPVAHLIEMTCSDPVKCTEP